MSADYVTSRYTFAFPVVEGVLLYSTYTGAVLGLTGADAEQFASVLAGPERPISGGDVPSELLGDLVESGMLLCPGTNALEAIRERYRVARTATPMALTITTTMDCNLGCYYCYEARSGDKLKTEDIDSIISLVSARLLATGKRSLHVDWYGGEPMLNVRFLESASRSLQTLCKDLAIAYSASIISNGTVWPADVGRFVRAHRIRQVQISFDGLQANHDKRRRFRQGRAPAQNDSSFKRAVELVDQLLDHVRVDVRINIDRNNAGDLTDFLAMMRERGWFTRRYPVVVQPARLSAYSEHSHFMRATEISGHEYDQLRSFVRANVAGETAVEESEAPDGFPFPRTSVCAALARDSIVVGADRELYRCGLQVGELSRAVGSLAPAVGARPRHLPVLPMGRADSQWWESFDPTTQPKCSECSFLPICWSGCPKKHLEGDSHAIDEQGEYWRRNLGRLVASGVGTELRAERDLCLTDQFRQGRYSDSPCGPSSRTLS